MRSGLLPSIGALGATLFFLIASEALAAPHDVILSEVQIGGEKASDSDEFVELYNPNTTAIDLSGFRLRYRNSSGTENSLSVLKAGSCIPAQGFFLWANSKGAYASLADITTSTTLTDNYTVLLYAPEASGGTLLDSLAWGAGTGHPTPVKQSLARDLADLSWRSLLTDPTPTKSTSCPLPEPTPTPEPSDVAVRFNEVLGNPAGDENEGEFIELYNPDEAAADISGFVIRDASKTGSYTFPPGTVIDKEAYFLLKRSISKISLNNSDETLSLFDRAQILVDTMHYDKTKEGVSLNYTAGGWRGGTPTPGTENQLNTLPDTKEKVPKKGYRGVPVAFDARGKDADGDRLKYTWNFGDDHKSYKSKTTHAYDKKGTYSVTLTTTDGSDDVIENFTLKIESFPEPDVRITALVPNPSGADTKSEWLLLENRGKKAVDLKGFGIATGWKKLSNHPIRESFIIAPKSEAKLTREFSLFTLPNEKGRIELRAPDGKVLQDIKYKLEKSAEEDAVYFKEKGKRWAWRAADKAVEPAATEPIAAEDVETSEVTSEVTPEDALSEPAPVEEPEQEVLGAAIVADTPNPNYLKLLNYGTGVTLPPDITLTFPDAAASSDGATEKEHYAVTFVKAVFTDVNTALNELQNEGE